MPSVVLPSLSSTIAAGAVLPSLPRRASSRSSAAVSASPVAVPPSACRPSIADSTVVVLDGRLELGLDRARVADEADQQLVGHAVHEGARGLLGGVEPRGLDVGGGHRAGLVGHEHHRRALDRHGDGGLRARERDREQDARRRPAGQGGRGGARPGRSPSTPAMTVAPGKRTAKRRRRRLCHSPQRRDERHHERGGQVGGGGEAHRSPFARSRSQSRSVASTTCSAPARRSCSRTPSRRSASAVA